MIYLYRWFLVQIVLKFVLPWYLPKERIRAFYPPIELEPIARKKTRIWFHAASTGELESLTPVIYDLKKQIPSLEVMITIFSPSAQYALAQLNEKLKQAQIPVVHSGFSPWEGFWETMFWLLKPDLFFTVKYEAWPDLWASLSRRKIPLVILGARPGGSYRFVKWALRFLLTRPGPITFLVQDEESERWFKRQWRHANLYLVGETRWKRVADRNIQPPSRLGDLKNLTKTLKRPFGFLSQIYPVDLKMLLPALNDFQGTLWVIPHRLDSASISEIEAELKVSGYQVFFSSQGALFENSSQKSADRIAFFLDEMGILTEVYSLADWAYVGGGFTEGIHSTIEPCFHGLPVSVGPKNFEKFSETKNLLNLGQLTRIMGAEHFLEWIKKVEADRGGHQTKWRESALKEVRRSEEIAPIVSKLLVQ